MAASDAIWAVDLGNNSLKALHLMAVGNSVQVIGFDNIPHGKVLSASGITQAEREELVAITLRQFVQRNDVSYDPLIISVPSQNSFARFVTLPPVEAKRLPEIVKFEAAQQIPFDMSEVQWDYVMMTEPDESEQKVGIFAIKNEVVESAVEHFEREDLLVSYVQMAPMALYNYLLYDRPELVRSDSQATVVINVGADSTDLVVCTKSGVWQRCIMMGGNAFTQAIAETFKLSPEKAEKLKRTAPVSKYARQIFQAMRPVFTEWTQEVQRSLGFYSNSNPDVKLTRIVALGGGTKLRGLLKYLGQTLQIPVEKPDMFKKVAVAQGLSAAKFHDGVADFGVVYGLGLQGLGLARIESNLLPSSVARSMAWANKTKYFIGAAVLFFIVSLMCLGRVGLERIGYARNADVRAQNARAVGQAQRLVDEALNNQLREEELVTQADEKFSLFKYREVIPEIYNLVQSALPNAENTPDQADLFEAYARGDADTVMSYDRPTRKQIFLVLTSIYYSVDIEGAQFGETTYARKQALVDEAKDDEEGGDRDRGRDIRQEMARERGMIDETEEKDPGFVVTVIGYSPYEQLGSLLHPTNVGDQPDKWGVVTRLRNLGTPDDPNVPLALLSATEGEHLRITTGAVDLGDENLPAGVGATVTVSAEEAAALTGGLAGQYSASDVDMLVDPVTGEYISAVAQVNADGTPKLDSLGKRILDERDQWFQMNFKLKWNAGPKQDEQVQ